MRNVRIQSYHDIDIAVSTRLMSFFDSIFFCFLGPGVCRIRGWSSQKLVPSPKSQNLNPITQPQNNKPKLKRQISLRRIVLIQFQSRLEGVAKYITHYMIYIGLWVLHVIKNLKCFHIPLVVSCNWGIGTLSFCITLYRKLNKATCSKIIITCR